MDTVTKGNGLRITRNTRTCAVTNIQGPSYLLLVEAVLVVALFGSIFDVLFDILFVGATFQFHIKTCFQEEKEYNA